MSAVTVWPKVRPQLTTEQTAVMEDWYKAFLGDVLPGKFGWISRFNHRYAVRTARPRSRTLEIGPGSGSHLEFENLAEQEEYVGVELRDSLTRQLHERYPSVRIVVGDCQERLDFEDSTFDRVLAIHVLEHLEDVPRALSEIHRVMKPTGLFSVLIPCEGGVGYTLGRKVTTQRAFEKRYGLPYGWMISYDHINQAREVLRELTQRFVVEDRSFFPLVVPSVDLNLVIGLTLRKG